MRPTTMLHLIVIQNSTTTSHIIIIIRLVLVGGIKENITLARISTEAKYLHPASPCIKAAIKFPIFQYILTL